MFFTQSQLLPLSIFVMPFSWLLLCLIHLHMFSILEYLLSSFRISNLYHWKINLPTTSLFTTLFTFSLKVHIVKTFYWIYWLSSLFSALVCCVIKYFLFARTYLFLFILFILFLVYKNNIFYKTNQYQTVYQEKYCSSLLYPILFSPCSISFQTTL